MKSISIFTYDMDKKPDSPAYLIDDRFAIYGDRRDGLIYLVEVESIPTGEPDTYRAIERFNYILVAKGRVTRGTIEDVVLRLKGMSAYTLITEHFNLHETEFNVNRKLERHRK